MDERNSLLNSQRFERGQLASDHQLQLANLKVRHAEELRALRGQQSADRQALARAHTDAQRALAAREATERLTRSQERAARLKTEYLRKLGGAAPKSYKGPPGPEDSGY